MEAAAALAQLTEVAADVREVVIASRAGAVEASAGTTAARAEALARAGVELLERAATEARPVARVHVTGGRPGLFVTAFGERIAVAVTEPAATPALVHHDLRTALRRSL